MISLFTKLLLFLTAVSGLLGILGKLWEKNKPGLAKNITWASIGCIALTFFLSVWKDDLTENERAAERRANQEEQGKLRGTIETQSTELGYLRGELRQAYETIADTRTKLVESQLASQKTTDAIQAYVYEELSLRTSRYLTILGQMIAEASDGWIPSNLEEFFSTKSVNLMCRWLNAEGKAPAYPSEPWYLYFAGNSKAYGNALANVLNSYASRLSPVLIDSVSSVASSALVGLTPLLPPTYRVSKEFGWKPSPMICAHILDPHYEKAFTQLSALVKQIAAGEKRFKLLPRMDESNFLKGLRSVTVGANRLDPSVVKRFEDAQKK